MANIERVKKAIKVMERVRDREDEFDMRSWQYEPERMGNPRKTEQELHECGTAACFAGWLAVSPEFQEDGGKVGECGEPIFRGFPGEYAVAAYLDISATFADRLCATTGSRKENYDFYGVIHLWDITSQHVIDKLQELINHG